MSLLPPLLGIYDIEVREFMFYPDDGSMLGDKQADPRISITIIELLVHEFFIKPERVLVFTCDNSDKLIRGLCRQKLFTKWHTPFQDNYSFIEMEVDIEMVAGIETLYGGVVFRNDFPHPEILKTQLLDEAQGIMMQKFGN